MHATGPPSRVTGGGVLPWQDDQQFPKGGGWQQNQWWTQVVFWLGSMGGLGLLLLQMQSSHPEMLNPVIGPPGRLADKQQLDNEQDTASNLL